MFFWGFLLSLFCLFFFVCFVGWGWGGGGGVTLALATEKGLRK